MKNIIFICLSMLLILVIPAENFAYTENASYGTVPKISEDIKIDGLKDKAYNNGLQINIDRVDAPPELFATAKAWYLWAEGRIYVYAEISNPDVLAHIDIELQRTDPLNSIRSLPFDKLVNPGLFKCRL